VTADELAAAAAALIARSRAAQGLPPVIDDPAAVRRIAALITRDRVWSDTSTEAAAS
jgi:hypothetical protein